jgi:hypothetical protein
LVFSILPLSEARFFNDLNCKEKQQIEAKVDSCYPVGLEKGHPTFVLRPLHRTSSAVQICRQTTNYYMDTENKELTSMSVKCWRGAPVGISRVKQIFLIFARFCGAFDCYGHDPSRLVRRWRKIG